MLTLAALTSAVVLAAPTPAADDEANFSYTFIELGGTRFDVGDAGGTGGTDVDSWYGRASLGLLGFFFGFIGYENNSTDFMFTDANRVDLGVGAHFGLTGNLDLVGSLAWLYNDVSTSGAGGGSEGGYEVDLGARWMPFHWTSGGLEFNGAGIWIDLDNRLASNSNDVGVRLGTRVHMLRLFSVGLDYTRFEDDNQVRLNARVSL